MFTKLLPKRISLSSLAGMLVLTACAGVVEPEAPTAVLDTPSPGVSAGCIIIDYALPSTEEAIDTAVAIVIGTVDALAEPDATAAALPIYQANILVEQVIRGEYSTGERLIVAVPGNCPEQGFIQPGERVLIMLEKRPISDHPTLYPYNKYLITEDGRALNGLDAAQDTTLSQLLALINRSQPPTDNAEQARQALITFFAHLRRGRYPEAATLYGGNYEALIEANPELDPQEHAALLQAACSVNGYQCLGVRNAVLETQLSPTGYQFVVEFENADGSLFALEGCCGGDETNPAQSQFVYTLLPDGAGGFLVQELPVYVP